MKYLDNISDHDIVELNIPTGIPLVYELDANLSPLKHYYLGDPEAAARPPKRSRSDEPLDRRTRRRDGGAPPRTEARLRHLAATRLLSLFR